MMDKERLYHLKDRALKLQKQISTFKASTDLKPINVPLCPYCNASQSCRYFLKNSKTPLYVPCSCTEMQANIRGANKLDELEEEFEIVNEKIDFYKEKSERLLSESNLGSRFRDRTFESFEPSRNQNAYNKAFSYAIGFGNNQGKGLIFTGNAGTGKTHLAAAITNYVASEEMIPVKFIASTEMANDMRATFSEPESEVKLREELYNIPLLVIDDLGKEKLSEYNERLLYSVINHRYEANLPIIITSNCNMRQLCERFDMAIFSRIAEMCEAIDTSGTDCRLEKFTT